MSNDCTYSVIYGQQGKIIAPRCYAAEMLALDELGIYVINSSCADEVIWVDDSCIEDMLSLGYEQICGGAFRPMSHIKETCYAKQN
nr:MAG TPA: hypothetical protein [Caudoviricetes sp.]